MDGGTAPGLRFALLGPVRAWRGDEPLPAGSPQQRALLAALLLRGGRTATADELIDALWGEAPPDSALAALRTYAFRLRKVLGANALTSESGGYALRTGPDTLDVTRAEEYAVEAEKARARGEAARARELLALALDLWDGEPLAGLPGPYAEAHRTRLSERRLALLETRLELDLELGGHTDAVSVLTTLSAEHPLRERLRALLMLALYRSGRQAEALGVYADTRRLLAEELGVDPCAELNELHQRILRADPDLAAQPPGTEDAPAAGSAVRPAQLPAAVVDFTGRDAFVDELVEELSTADSGVMALSAVAGIGGVGKTTLAVHVAHAARDAFPDGQLYVDLQGQDARPSEPETVLASFLRALGTPDAAIPEGLEDRAALYRSVLDGRRVLALLDNAHDAAQVRPLLPGTPGCAALITSRVRMVDLAGAHLVDLDVMSPEEALQLFTKIVGPERVLTERQAALDVVAACGFLPLAIRIAASRLATRRTWTVSVLARKLSDSRRRLDELKAGDLAVKATFELGYGQLAGHQARAFRLLALPEGPDISLEAAAAVLDMDAYEAEELLETLVDISLLESAAPARYRYHDLLRLYARDRAEQDETPQDRRAALSRLLDFYLATAAGAYELENPGDRVLSHMAPTSRSGLAFSSRAEGLEWLFSEASCVLATVRQAAEDAADGDHHRRAVDLLFVAQDLMESGVHARAYEQCARSMAAVSAQQGDALVEGRARVLLGRILSWSSSRWGEADIEAQRAQLLGLSAQDLLTCSYAPNLRGLIARDQQRFQDAEAYYQLARESFRDDANLHGEASVLANLARIRIGLGETALAVAAGEQAVALQRRLETGFRLGCAQYSLAIALAEDGQLDAALGQLTDALAQFRESRQPVWEGLTLFRMAEVHVATGRHRQAASLADQALALVNDNAGENRKAGILTALGKALNGIGQVDRARACWRDALAAYTALGAKESEQVRALLGEQQPAVPPVAVQYAR
ncbi:BTAD domain-containing putative transcriptional regulator [Streptomyces sp. ICBB 8177]|uniref:AfsR/SARP family transcriptional regulator n=1 Tax=Streptomyces sp. ICBB 8177 TaxID=563922 RepID=UPI000D68316B|nr:BTAD domain-containing putative transcriptional regulator [Streptomyces sp. ICBB 8177]PWI45924.1 AfsR family transcriptional regulator [Streptomyces sp. ICBB 8177]